MPETGHGGNAHRQGGEVQRIPEGVPHRRICQDEPIILPARESPGSGHPQSEILEAQVGHVQDWQDAEGQEEQEVTFAGGRTRPVWIGGDIGNLSEAGRVARRSRWPRDSLSRRPGMWAPN